MVQTDVRSRNINVHDINFPIVVQDNTEFEQRALACYELGWKTVPVVTHKAIYPMNLKKIRVSNKELNRAKRQPQFANTVANLKTNITPVVIDTDHNIIAGHLRFTAALTLGWEQIPVEFVEQVSEIKRLTPGQRLWLIATKATTLTCDDRTVIHASKWSRIEAEFVAAATLGGRIRIGQHYYTVCIPDFEWFVAI